MKAPIIIPARERGVVRVFALSMSDIEASALKDNPKAVAEVLGTTDMLNLEHVELFPVSDLDGVGLLTYLHEGAGVPEDQLAPDRAILDRLGGWIMVIFSLAFEDRAETMHPTSAFTLIGTYGEVPTDYTADEPLTAEAAKPYTAPPETTKKRPSDAAMSGRVAMLVLIVLAIFTYFFIRMAG